MKKNHPLNQSPPSKTRLALVVGVLAAVAVVGSSQAQSLCNDDFESYADQTACNAVWQALGVPVALTFDTTRSHTTTGGATKSIKQIADGATSGRSWKALDSSVLGHKVYMRFWFYDANITRCFGALEGYSGVYGTGLQQKICWGAYNTENTGYYQAREVNGLAMVDDGGTRETGGNSTWFYSSIAKTFNRWHKMEIVGGWDPNPTYLAKVRYRFYVDGVLGGSDHGDSDRTFTHVSCGSVLTATGTASSFDEVVVEALTMQPQIDVGGDVADVSVNELSPATFTITASTGSSTLNTYAANTLTYQWQRNTGAGYGLISGATGSSYQIPVTHLADAGSYQCIVSDAYGRAVNPVDGYPLLSREAILAVTQLTSAVIQSQTGGGTVNAGVSTTFNVVATGDAVIHYAWTQNPGNISRGGDSDTLTINPVQASDAGTYTCTVNNDTPPSFTGAGMVLTVNSPPTLTALPATIPMAAKLELRQHATSTPALSKEGTLFQDFEAFGSGANIMFGQPSFSGTTGGNLDTTAGHNNFTHTTSVYPAGHLSPHVLQSSWTFGTGSTLRFTTSVGSTGNRPIISYSTHLRFDMCSDLDMKVAIGVRDANPTGAIGTSDVTSAAGNIEWVGVTTTPTPDRQVTANTWQTLDFHLGTDPVKNAWGVGNGILESTTGKGDLEDLYLMGVDSLPNDNNIYLDNFVVLDAHPIWYTLGTVTGPATGATIDQYTGKITWTPTALGAVSFEVTAHDDYGLTSTQTETVTVVPTPATIDMITQPDPVTGDMIITGHGAALQNYKVWSADELSSDPAAVLVWTDTGFTDTTQTGSFNIPVAGPAPTVPKFYKVQSY